VIYTGVASIWNNEFAKTDDFTHWQTRYKQVAYDLATDPVVKQATLATPVEVKQVTATEFNMIQADNTTQQRVDRCQSCHVGLLNPQMTAENIIKAVDHVTVPTDQVVEYLEKHAETRRLVHVLGAHPGLDITGDNPRDLGVVHGPDLTYGVATETSLNDADRADYADQKQNLKQHPFPLFGCTTCHYGSGRDLVEERAHGDPDSWLMPMLKAKHMDAACAQCHAQYDPKTFKINYLPRMKTIAKGEELFKAQACYGCHKIEGFSKGNIGPELTFIGRTRVPEAIEHQLWDPRYRFGNGSCVMPYFFSVRKTNTDVGDPAIRNEVVDERANTVEHADVEKEDPQIKKSLDDHGYIADKSRQDDVDALVTFVASQTGMNYAASQSSRIKTVSAFNDAPPTDVPVTAEEGKKLFEESGCYACHYLGDPNNHKNGKGGHFAPELSWEGSRHSVEWLMAHYKNPQAFVPNSIMPIFPFTDSQRAALSLYDASNKSRRAGGLGVSANQDLPNPDDWMKGVLNKDVRYLVR
jgi:cbb3-type cytochrome oxidase cytochrome c subunit